MSRILLMTDSTCDLPAEWVMRYDIRVVPTYVQFGGKSLADDGVQLTRQDFYKRLVTSHVHPTTAAPPPGQTLAIMRQALNDADHVIALTAPAKLSGIHNTFRIAVEQTDPKRVTLIDSGMLSMGMGWMVVIAAEMAESGASPNEIAAALVTIQPRVDVYAALDTMYYLRRSGRVGWAASVVGNLLNIKPVVRQRNSEVSSVTRVRTRQRMFNTLADLAHQNAPLDWLAIMHTANLDGAQRLVEALADIHPDHDPVIVEATPVLGVHVGPKALGLGLVRAASRQ